MSTSDAEKIVLRTWRLSDREALLKYINNHDVWINLSDRIPHPYLEANADQWLKGRQNKTPQVDFAIDLEGEAIGGIGFELLQGIYRITANIGYWLAQPFWGRGIGSKALARATQYGLQELGLERLQAEVFAHNRASARILEKCGYQLEATLRRNTIKDGRIHDSLLYARLRADE